MENPSREKIEREQRGATEERDCVEHEAIAAEALGLGEQRREHVLQRELEVVALPAHARRARRQELGCERTRERLDLQRAVRRDPLPRVEVGAAVADHQHLLRRVGDVPDRDRDDGDDGEHRADVRGTAHGRGAAAGAGARANTERRTRGRRPRAPAGAGTTRRPRGGGLQRRRRQPPPRSRTPGPVSSAGRRARPTARRYSFAMRSSAITGIWRDVLRS